MLKNRHRTYVERVLALGIGVFVLLSLPFKKAQAVEHVTLQLRWDHQFQFAGYYAAEWQGFYAENGLTVEIRSALTSTGILSATQEVQDGRADFGVGAADILIARDRGADLSVIAVIFQQSAAAFYLKAETPYASLADFTKLRVARRVNDLIDVELQAMLRSEGIDPARITPYPHQSGIDHFLTDRVQVMPGYRTSIPFLMEQHGQKLREIRPNQYGIDFYGDSLFCQTQLARTRPDLVARFMKASLQGWAYALDHPDEIAEKIVTRFVRRDSFPGGDLMAFNCFQADVVRDLTLSPIIELGHINPYRWERMHALLTQAGLVKRPLDLSAFVFDEEKNRDIRDARRQRFLIEVAVLSLLALAMATIFLMILRRMVRQRTAALQAEIVGREHAQKALQKSEERLKNVLEILPVGVWIADQRGAITHGNPASQAIWAGARYVGPDRFGEYKAWWVATGEALKPEDWGVARAITRGERSIEEELEIECFDGTHKIILNWAVPLWGHDHTIEGAVVVNQDITERKRAEETLRESEKRFRWLFDNSINAVALHEIVVNDQGEPVDYIFLNVNHGFEFHTGMRAADIVGKRVTQAFPGIEKTNLIAMYGKVALTGEPTSFEMYFEPLQRDYSITAYQVGKGRFAAVFEDITDRKRAEMALRESEERLRMVIDNSRDGINMLDLKTGRYVFMSPAQVELTGFSIEEMNNFPVEEAYERVHPDDREISISQQQRVAAGEDILTPVEYRWKVKSGEYRWFSDSRKAIRDEQGRAVALVGVSRDITEYKRAEEALYESEERFHAALEASLQAFTIMRSIRDAQRRIIDFEWTYANPMAGEILKQSPESLVGRRLLDTLPGNRENRALFDRYVWIVETGQGDEMELEYVSEGISGWFRNMAVKLGDGVAISFSNITDHKRTEELLKNQNVLLEQAVQQKQREMEGLFERLLRQEKLATIGQMAGSIAHELRNPLGAVKQSVFYLKRLAQRQELTTSNPNVLRQLNLMDEELDISGRVITDLLDMTRMKPLQCQATDLRALLADTITHCHLPERVRVTIALEPEQFVIFVDPLQMRQVVLNILTNATQAIKGEGAITIRARQVIEQQESVIEIHDSGVGLTPEALQKVFEPLYTTKATGTGLGLSICKQIIESHHGRISLTSQPGQGATVTIMLPWNDNRVTNY